MSTIRRFLCWPVALWLLLSPLNVPAQERNTADLLKTLPLATLDGAVPVYYSPGHAERARRLQQAYAGAVAFYCDFFRGAARADMTPSLALLEPKHWAAFTSRPYGIPHFDLGGWPAAVAVLPATNDQGLTADLLRALGVDPGTVGRAVDVIGFHEFGHMLMRQYFYGTTLATREFSVRWVEEFMATYLGHGYLWHSEGLAADPIRAEWVRDVTVRYATLADFEEHMHDEYVQTEKGWTNYGWYQMQFAERGRDVFAKQGLEFIRRVRDELPWDRYAEWRTDELLQWLEKIEPGFITWARALER